MSLLKRTEGIVGCEEREDGEDANQSRGLQDARAIHFG